MNKGEINKITGAIESNTVALEKVAHYLKTIAFNTAKIDADIHKTPFKIRGRK